MHKNRLLSSLIMSGLVIIMLALPDGLFALSISIFIALGLNEFFALLGKTNMLDNNRFVGIFFGAIIPIFYYWSAVQNDHSPEAAIVLLVFIFFIYQFFRRDGRRAVINIALITLGVIYIGFNLSFLVKIKMVGSSGDSIILSKTRVFDSGSFFVLYLLLVAKFGDIGAYLIGSHFGRHRLIPRISPNKSIEGAIGGLGFSLAVSLLSFPLLAGVGIMQRLVLGIILGILAQVGDLTESLIKRDCQVKDSGDFIPGLGGCLDIIDSIIFVAPAFYFYLVIFR